VRFCDRLTHSSCAIGRSHLAYFRAFGTYRKPVNILKFLRELYFEWRKPRSKGGARCRAFEQRLAKYRYFFLLPCPQSGFKSPEIDVGARM